MRSDMKDLIIDTGRPEKDLGRSKSYFRYDPSQKKKFPRDAKMRKMRPLGAYVTLGDRLSPLARFLESRIGKPWDKVYSEICEKADARSLRGHHLRQHVHYYVASSEDEVRYYGFYVDSNGFLRKKDNSRRKYPRPPKLEFDHPYTFDTLVGRYEVVFVKADLLGFDLVRYSFTKNAQPRQIPVYRRYATMAARGWPDAFGPCPFNLESYDAVVKSKRQLSGK